MCGWDGYVYFLEILYYQSPISTQEGAYTESKWHYLPIDPLRLLQHLNNTRLRNLVGQEVNETQYEWYPVNLNAVRGAFDNIPENFE